MKTPIKERNTQFTPLDDRILILQIKEPRSAILETPEEDDSLITGNAIKGQLLEIGTRIEPFQTPLIPGQTVAFIDHSALPIVIDGEKLLLVREKDILAILD